MKNALAAAALVAGLSCLAQAQQPLVVELVDPESLLIGTATFSQGPGGVTIALDLHDLQPGVHALDLHENPECRGWSLSSAGGHFNPAGKRHGAKNPEGPHAGDLGNFTAAADGSVKATLTATGISLDAGAPNSVFANEGTSLIIHEHADDMTTDPEGGAGERLACGAILKK